MNSLSQTKIFNRISKIFGSLEKTLTTIDFTPYRVPESLYMDLYVEQMKNYAYPLARQTLEACKKLTIRPVLLAEPQDRTIEEMSKRIPQTIFTFGAIDKVSKKFVCYVDTSMKARYIRDKMTGSITGYKIDPAHFYAYMQTGLIFSFCKLNNNRLNNAKILLRELCSCFVVLLGKVIDMKLSVSANRLDFHLLMFLSACYFYEALCGFKKEKAIESAKQLKFIMKDSIDSRCEYLNNDALNMSLEPSLVQDDIYPIDKFVSIISRQFNLGDKINYRDLVTWWSNLYGSQSIAAIEDSTTFFTMMMLVQLRTNFYNDMTIISALKKEIANLPKLITPLL